MEQTSTWKAFNNEMIASLKKMKSARAEQKLEIDAENKEKEQLEKEMAFIQKKLKIVNRSLMQKVSTSRGYETDIKTAEEAYVTFLESSQRFQSILQRNSPNFAAMEASQYSMEQSKDEDQNDLILLNSTQSSEDYQIPVPRVKKVRFSLASIFSTPIKEYSLSRMTSQEETDIPILRKSILKHPKENCVNSIKKEKVTVTVKIERKVENKMLITKMNIKLGTTLQKVLRSYTSKYKLVASRLVFVEDGRKLDKFYVFESSKSLMCYED